MDKEINALQKKIEEQEDQNKKLKMEEDKIIKYIQEFKEAIKKKA